MRGWRGVRAPRLGRWVAAPGQTRRRAPVRCQSTTQAPLGPPGPLEGASALVHTSSSSTRAHFGPRHARFRARGALRRTPPQVDLAVFRLVRRPAPPPLSKLASRRARSRLAGSESLWKVLVTVGVAHGGARGREQRAFVGKRALSRVWRPRRGPAPRPIASVTCTRPTGSAPGPWTRR